MLEMINDEMGVSRSHLNALLTTKFCELKRNRLMQKNYKNTLQKETILDKRNKENLHSKLLAIQVELLEINYIVQSRKNTPIDSYIELDAMLEKVNRRRKK